MEAASSANLQELRRRVWYLPHVCVAIFEELVKSLGPEDCHFDFLRPYLTLDKATCLDLAPMLYDYIILDQFPWHCPDEVSAIVQAVADPALRSARELTQLVFSIST